VNSPPPKPEVILTNFFAEPTVLLVPITSRESVIKNFVFVVTILLVVLSVLQIKNVINLRGYGKPFHPRRKESI
jgi:hypothetical protein